VATFESDYKTAEKQAGHVVNMLLLNNNKKYNDCVEKPTVLWHASVALATKVLLRPLTPIATGRLLPSHLLFEWRPRNQ
jgi:hypothetical protein